MKNRLPLILISIILVLAGVAGFMLSRSSFSKEMMKLEVIGPDEIYCGKEDEYILKFKNNGNSTLEELRLNVEFPEHSIIADQESNMVVVEADKIEPLAPGREGTVKIKARIFGKESESFPIKATLTYSPKGLTARYSSKSEKEVRIKDVPISFEYDAPSRAETGKDLMININYFSHIDYPLTDLAVEMEYPEGFDFIESKPKAVDENKWEIESLSENTGGRISISGILYGQSSDKKVFKSRLGMYINGEFIVLKEQEFDISIKKSLMEISQNINGQSQVVANMGQTLNYDISFKNTGDGVYKDLNLAVKLKGELFDFGEIKADGAEVRSGDTTIVWNSEKNPDLKILAPGETGSVKFSIKVLDSYDSKLVNPELIDKVIINEIQQEFRTKINSNIVLNSRAMSGDEVFESAGPIPLEVGKKSELTVVWDLVNYFNDLENVKVKGVMPENVSYTGKVAPQNYSKNFTLDSDSRELVWNVGDMESGMGIGTDKKILTFQIDITPTADQKNDYAVILKSLKVLGADKWTGEEIEYNFPDFKSIGILSLDKEQSKVK